ncbi:3-phenylpropionate/cinnamic acid dioxygenase subunit beta [Streptomyces sp. B1866]|uniref:3-phenylpropionate/cinnamic acid dioxygenase subunit beta n=1 Tax=Streptomyces sp. B1866 TaxID=3075431 RepID=UPI00288EA62A|nr:3-phenylpropionate/cinnamic acid dioxygenase subunit beta [Streptomyces sp. B1866]MDT3398205.1 3-phenylpropionate/cinnamic acid dioxygenase subunit beta [Streptomyces sp. B1866]
MSTPPASRAQPRAASPGRVPDAALVCEVQQFLYLEARLLDAEAYHDWLDLLTEDVRYWVPGVEYRQRRDTAGPYGPGRMAYFDDTKETLARRVRRLTDATAWSEDPPTRHLHLVSNIEVAPAADPRELLVRSAFVNYRSQWGNEETVLYGRREDILRRGDDGRLRIARRAVELRHGILPGKNINTFF